MSAKDNRQQLVDFINKKLFDPILKAKPDKLKEEDKKILEDIQRKTEDEKRKFNEVYTTAKEVKENYLDNVRSKPAAKLNDQLEKFKLPTMPQHKDEFLELCEKVGI